MTSLPGRRDDEGFAFRQTRSAPKGEEELRRRNGKMNSLRVLGRG